MSTYVHTYGVVGVYVQSLPRALTANLNQKLIALHTSEAAALQKAESHCLRVSSLQAVLWKTERKLEEKKEEVFGVRRDFNGKVEQLQTTLRVCVLWIQCVL